MDLDRRSNNTMGNDFTKGRYAHNNMVPHFKRLTQNMSGTGAPNDFRPAKNGQYSGITTLQIATGTDFLYKHKRESENIFNDVPTSQNIYGLDTSRQGIDNIKRTIENNKNGMMPTEPIKVGPGLNLGMEVPAIGGFHDTLRVMPGLQNGYRLNQLEGTVVQGKHFNATMPPVYPGIGGAHEISPGVVKNGPSRTFKGPDLFPTSYSVKAGASAVNMSVDYESTFKPKIQNSGNNLVSYYGPYSSHVSMQMSRDMEDTQTLRNIADNPYNTINIYGNPQSERVGSGSLANPTTDSWTVNGTQREVEYNEDMKIMGANMERHGPTTSYTYEDRPKETRNESTHFSYNGAGPSYTNAGTNKWTYDDGPKDTRQDSMHFSYNGAGPSYTNAGTNKWTYDDGPKDTRQDSMHFSYNGAGPSYTNAGTNKWTYVNLPKSTIRDTTSFSSQGAGPSYTNAGTNKWTSDTMPKNSIRDTTHFSSQGSGPSTHVHMPMNRDAFVAY